MVQQFMSLPVTHILFDAARMGEHIDEAKELNQAHDSLYRGGSEESLSAVAPYIFLFDFPTPFSNWYFDNGWGDAWGILLKSSRPMQELHKHFRKFLIVGTEDNQELYFRFYDPRVLRIFLPTCSSEQLREFFGPIEYFLIEDEDPSLAIRCWLQNGQLRTAKVPLEDVLSGKAIAAAADNTQFPVDGVSGSSAGKGTPTSKPQSGPGEDGTSGDDKGLDKPGKSKWTMLE